MAVMNGFLFLMLILCGTAVGMILQNMKMMEERAERAMTIVRAQAERTNLPGSNDAVICENNETSYDHSISAFLTIPTIINISTTNTAIDPMESKINYDFALASERKIKSREQGDGFLLPEIVRIDICA